MNEMEMIYDVIIIGGGAAGISAALWCDDLKLDALLLERETEFGGQLLRVYNPIKNHLGIETKNGRDLRDTFLKQVENCRFETRFESKIARVDFKNKLVEIETAETFRARTIIIASGVRRRKLNIEGEEKFKGKGIIKSGKRDAPLVENKRVCIVGGGDAAFENALILSEIATRVMLVHRGEMFRARDEFIAQVKSNPKIEILAETIVRKIGGDEKVETVEFRNLKTGEIYTRNTDAILLRIGVEPNTDFLDGKLNLDKEKYIEVNQFCETNMKGVFAVGDVANPIAPTVSTAVGMGATAVKAIFAQLNS